LLLEPRFILGRYHPASKEMPLVLTFSYNGLSRRILLSIKLFFPLLAVDSRLNRISLIFTCDCSLLLQNQQLLNLDLHHIVI
jgi:hypothetical protein